MGEMVEIIIEVFIDYLGINSQFTKNLAGWTLKI